MVSEVHSAGVLFCRVLFLGRSHEYETGAKDRGESPCDRNRRDGRAAVRLWRRLRQSQRCDGARAAWAGRDADCADGCARDARRASDSFVEAEILLQELTIAHALELGMSAEDVEQLRAMSANPEYLASLEAIQRSILERHALLSDLAALYAGWYDLAANDFGRNVASHASALSSTAAQYAESAGYGTAESRAALVDLIGAAAQAVANAIQRRQLYEANRHFAELVPQVVELLEAESRLYDSLQERINEKRLSVTEALLDTGIGKPNSFLAKSLAEYELDFDAQNYEEHASAEVKSAVQDAVKRIAAVRLRRETQVGADVLGESLRTLRELAAAHREMQQRRGFSPELVDEALADLRLVVSKATAYANARNARRADAAVDQAAWLDALQAAVTEAIRTQIPMPTGQGG